MYRIYRSYRPLPQRQLSAEKPEVHAINIIMRTKIEQPFPMRACAVYGKRRPRRTSNSVIALGYVGKAGLFSRTRAAMPNFVAKRKGIANQLRPPIIWLMQLEGLSYRLASSPRHGACRICCYCLLEQPDINCSSKNGTPKTTPRSTPLWLLIVR